MNDLKRKTKIHAYWLPKCVFSTEGHMFVTDKCKFSPGEVCSLPEMQGYKKNANFHEHFGDWIILDTSRVQHSTYSMSSMFRAVNVRRIQCLNRMKRAERNAQRIQGADECLQTKCNKERQEKSWKRESGATDNREASSSKWFEIAARSLHRVVARQLYGRKHACCKRRSTLLLWPP